MFFLYMWSPIKQLLDVHVKIKALIKYYDLYPCLRKEKWTSTVHNKLLTKRSFWVFDILNFISNQKYHEYLRYLFFTCNYKLAQFNFWLSGPSMAKQIPYFG